jgi:hypothetical protein
VLLRYVVEISLMKISGGAGEGGYGGGGG